MNDYAKELSVAKDIARQAGEIMKSYFNSDLVVERKGDGSPLTEADTKINRLVIEELGKHFDDGVVGEEESTADYGMGRRWICDPIDGTKAFTWGVPTAMFSLGFVVDGVPMVGVAFDPFLDRMYEAHKGAGAFCSGQPIRVSNEALSGGYVGMSSDVSKVLNDPAQADLTRKILAAGARTAYFSGSVYKTCLVARGKFVGYIEKGVNAHDMAATHVIVEEAGGKITGLKGETLDYSHAYKGAVVSNGIVHDEMISICSNL